MTRHGHPEASAEALVVAVVVILMDRAALEAVAGIGIVVPVWAE
jgi:hypothetical protein